MWHCGSSTPRGHHILRSVCFKSRPRLCDMAKITYRYAIYHVLGDLWIMGSISHFQFAEHLLEGSGSLQFPTSHIDDLRREIATTIMTGSGKHFKSLNQRAFLIRVQVRIEPVSSACWSWVLPLYQVAGLGIILPNPINLDFASRVFQILLKSYLT